MNSTETKGSAVTPDDLMSYEGCKKAREELINCVALRVCNDMAGPNEQGLRAALTQSVRDAIEGELRNYYDAATERWSEA